MANDGLNEFSTHDLWIEARQFAISLTRESPTSLKLTIKKPISLDVVDGALITIGSKEVTQQNYPQDGESYHGSTVYGDISASTVDGFQVVAFYSQILSNPFPTGTLTADGKFYTWDIIVTNTDANTLYYASIHPTSNILQYYPIGVQSYPLEASRIEKDSSTYAGNIPNLTVAPTNPTHGFIYYDKTLNVVQYWDGDLSVWIPSRIDNILTGPTNPCNIGQVYLLAGSNQLKIFANNKWNDITSSNFQFKVGMTWVPFNSSSLVVSLPDAKQVGDFVYNLTTQQYFYWDGTTWNKPEPTNSIFTSGGVIPAFTTPVTVEYSEFINPTKGLLFYNSSTKNLMIWNGSSWIRANTDQQGTPLSDKIGYGSDGSYDERLRLIKILKAQMGYPSVCVELTEEHFNIAIDNALDTYRQLSGGAYEKRYILFNLNPNQSLYFLNSPVDGTDRVVTVSAIHRLSILGANAMNWNNQVYFQAFMNQVYNNGNNDILSVHLMHSMAEEFNKVFAGNYMYTWNEARRELVLLRRVVSPEKVILEVQLERPEQEIFLDRWCKQFIQNWALAECKNYLGLIRSKYSSGTPGAGGNITLNGEALLSEAEADFTALKQGILDFEYGGIADNGGIAFIIG